MPWLKPPLAVNYGKHYDDVIMTVMASHQPHDCLLNRLFRRISKKTSKLRVTGLCAENSPWTGEFPAQMASNAENVSIWWRHHDLTFLDSHLNYCICMVYLLIFFIHLKFRKIINYYHCYQAISQSIHILAPLTQNIFAGIQYPTSTDWKERTKIKVARRYFIKWKVFFVKINCRKCFL